jgi:hypothetical protein
LNIRSHFTACLKTKLIKAQWNLEKDLIEKTSWYNDKRLRVS